MQAKIEVSRAQLLTIANEELRKQPFHRPGDEITEARMAGHILVLAIPGDDYHVLEPAFQAFAHDLGERYRIVAD